MVYVKVCNGVLYNPSIRFYYNETIDNFEELCVIILYIDVNGNSIPLRYIAMGDDCIIDILNEFIEKCINDLFDHISNEKYDFNVKLNELLKELDKKLK